MPTQHALLSPSGAERWLACPPSVRWEEKLYEPPPSADMLTGTLAHAIAETRLKYMYGQIDKRKHDRDMKKLRADKLYGPVMDEYLDGYIDYVVQVFDEAKTRSADAEIMLETQLDFSRWAPEGFGTGDVLIVSGPHADVIDLKYGKGVPVNAEGNPQLRLYGLGAFAYAETDMFCELTDIRIHVVQPRLDSITVETLTAGELLQWANDVVIPAAKLAFAGEGEYKSGDHCRWCRARNLCRRYHFDQLELARYDFREPAKLTDEETADVLEKADRIARWTKQVKDYAEEQAVNHGKHWPGWKLVTGRSNRVITDQTAAIELLDLEGYPIAQTCTLRGLGALEELVGKKKLPEVLGELLIKPEGAPALVRDTDKRPALNTAAQAQKDFEEDI